jgi:hypothetical protein
VKLGGRNGEEGKRLKKERKKKLRKRKFRIGV